MTEFSFSGRPHPLRPRRPALAPQSEKRWGKKNKRHMSSSVGGDRTVSLYMTSNLFSVLSPDYLLCFSTRSCNHWSPYVSPLYLHQGDATKSTARNNYITDKIITQRAAWKRNRIVFLNWSTEEDLFWEIKSWYSQIFHKQALQTVFWCIPSAPGHLTSSVLRTVTEILIDVLFPRYLFTFVCEAKPSQTPPTPSVLLHMCKVQRSACACVWVVGPSGIKPTSCLTDSNSPFHFLLTHTSLDFLSFSKEAKDERFNGRRAGFWGEHHPLPADQLPGRPGLVSVGVLGRGPQEHLLHLLPAVVSPAGVGGH